MDGNASGNIDPRVFDTGTNVGSAMVEPESNQSSTGRLNQKTTHPQLIMNMVGLGVSADGAFFGRDQVGRGPGVE